MDFDADECQFMLEDLFSESELMEEDELLTSMEYCLAMCGADETTDSAEVVECVSTAAHNANVQHRIGRLLGFE